MNETKVVSNYHLRDILYFYELDLYGYDQDKVRDEFDWKDNIEDEGEFFIYKGDLYILDDFMSLHNKFYCPNPPDFMEGWDGYYSFGFIGGLVVKYPYDEFIDQYDYEHIIVGWY